MSVFQASKEKETVLPKKQGVFSVSNTVKALAGPDTTVEEYINNMISGAVPAGGLVGTLGKRMTVKELDALLKGIKRTPEINLNLDTLKPIYGKLKDWAEKKEAIEPLRQALKAAGVPRESSYPATFRLIERFIGGKK